MLIELSATSPTFTRRMRPLLGCFVEVASRGEHALSSIDRAFVMLEKAQALWSFQDPESELTTLNSHPLQMISVDPLTARLLRLSRALMLRTEARFDCSLGGLLVERGILPNHDSRSALTHGCPDDIVVCGNQAMLRRPIKLCLDGIAKGFAVDCAIHAMRSAGASAGWINAGGDLRVFGDCALRVQRREWDGSLRDLGLLQNAALATSRVAEASLDFPSHIVAPPGVKAEKGIWSVLAKSAWRADALTKVAAGTAVECRQSTIASLGACLLCPQTSVNHCLGVCIE